MIENRLYGGANEAEKDSEPRENSIEVKKREFLEYIESRSESTKDMMYMLHSLIEQGYEQAYQNASESLNSILQLLAKDYRITVGDALDTPDAMMSLFLFMQQHNDGLPASKISVHPEQLQKIHGRILNLKSLQSFQLQEKTIIELVDSQIEGSEAFRILTMLSHSGRLIKTLRTKELPAPFVIAGKDFKSFDDVLVHLQNTLYAITSQATKKLLPILRFLDSAEIAMSTTRNPGQISVGLSRHAFDNVASTCKYKLTDNDLQLLDIIRADALHPDSCSFMIEQALPAQKYQEYLDDFLEQLYKNIWVQYQLDVIDGARSVPDDTDFVSEMTDYYKDSFAYAQTPWRKFDPEELEEDSHEELMESASAQQTYLYTPHIPDEKSKEIEYPTLDQFLSKRTLRKMKSLQISEQMVGKMNSVLKYIADNKSQCAQNITKIARAMSPRVGELPFVQYGYGKMKFGEKIYKKMIKFNVDKGHRVKMYFDRNEQLQVIFETGQVYHNDRKG